MIAVDSSTVQVASSHAAAVASSNVTLTTAGTGSLVLSATATTTAQGAEILNIARGPRVHTLSLQCFAVTGTGVGNARATLARVLNSTTLPTIAAALVAGGVGISDWSKVGSAGGILNTVVFEPRATVTVKLLVANEMSETGTYIEQVSGTGVVSGSIGDVDVVVDVEGT